MECPKCKQEYGEMITICPMCFIEIAQPVSPSITRNRKGKKEIPADSDSKSKGLLASSFSSWFGGRTKEAAPVVKQEKKRGHEHKFTKSSAADYASFSIDTGVTEMPGVETFQIMSPSQSFITDPVNLITDGSFSDKSEPAIMDNSVETMVPSSVPAPTYEAPVRGTATRGSPSRDQLAQEHYRKGYEYEKQNRLKEALAEYGQAVAFNPKWPEPYYRCGLILVKNKDYNTALQKLLEAVKLDPANADAHYQIGKIYVDRNFKDDAEKYLKLAVSKNPKLTAAKNLLENLYGKVASVTQKSCPKCNSLQSNRAKFCGNCGYTFPKS
ncbi:MAG: tetratricopeptide repeat protein [Candidatus Eremiobacterota bacterium]